MTDPQRDPMHPDHDGPSTPTRRAVLRTGGLTALGAVFLAACGSSASDTGLSGARPSVTLVEPTVPVTAPSKVSLDEETVQRSTLASLELLVAQVYGDLGPDLDDPELVTAAERFALDHGNTASAIRNLGETNAQALMPNEYLQTRLVDPAKGSLNSEDARLTFLASMESALVATYLNATGIFYKAADRKAAMAYAAAAARRIGAIAPGTTGAPTDSLYPLNDLIPADAYVGRAAEGS